jgi:hypothetical protein
MEGNGTTGGRWRRNREHQRKAMSGGWAVGHRAEEGYRVGVHAIKGRYGQRAPSIHIQIAKIGIWANDT